MALGKPLDLAGPEFLVHTVKVMLPTSQGSGGNDSEVMKNTEDSGGRSVLGRLSGWWRLRGLT